MTKPRPRVQPTPAGATDDTEGASAGAPADDGGGAPRATRPRARRPSKAAEASAVVAGDADHDTAAPGDDDTAMPTARTTLTGPVGSVHDASAATDPGATGPADADAAGAPGDGRTGDVVAGAPAAAGVSDPEPGAEADDRTDRGSGAPVTEPPTEPATEPGRAPDAPPGSAAMPILTGSHETALTAAEATDLARVVDEFSRAEQALAAITADAGRLAVASEQTEEAKGALVLAGQDLKMVAGALVGLATAHRELVAQLGTAATALQRGDGGSDRLLGELRAAETDRGHQLAELLGSVEELARRIDGALAQHVGDAVDRLGANLPTVAHLDGLARADDLARLDARLDELSRFGQDPEHGQALARIEQSLDLAPLSGSIATMGRQLEGVATEQAVTALAERLRGLATAEEVNALGKRFDGLASADELAAVRAEVAKVAGAADESAVKRLADLEQRVADRQARIHWIVFAEGAAFLVFAAALAILALR